MNVKKLLNWAEKRKNVLLIGSHGVGKTAIITETFEKFYGERNKDWIVLSGATLDPWTDLIGIPHVQNIGYEERELNYIRPKFIKPNNLKAIFIDELNRTHKSVRNALMELIQFKTINGQKFPKLEVVWGAINPENDKSEYDVDVLDPAQKDRFHVIVSMNESPSRVYFKRKFGNDIGEQAVAWWEQQAEKTKKEISPRRLDYVLEHFLEGGNIRDIIGHTSGNCKLLFDMLNTKPSITQFENCITNEDYIEFFNDENKVEEALDWILKNNPKIANKYLSLEKKRNLILNNPKLKKILDIERPEKIEKTENLDEDWEEYLRKFVEKTSIWDNKEKSFY
jgi:hypothetical protein